MVRKLTTKWGLVSPIRAVRDTVTEEIQVDTGIVARALPLPKGTAKSLGRAVLLITHIPAVIVPVTGPRSEDAVSVVTEEVSWGAGLRDTAIVLVRAVDAVGMFITLPGVRDTGAVALALKLIWVAHAGRPGCWEKQRHMDDALGFAIYDPFCHIDTEEITLDKWGLYNNN